MSDTDALIYFISFIVILPFTIGLIIGLGWFGQSTEKRKRTNDHL